VNSIPGKVGSLGIIFDKVIQEIGQMKALLENELPSANVRVNAPEMEVVGEGVQVHQDLHLLTLGHKLQDMLEAGSQRILFLVHLM
jgi:hypothetical protein